MVDGPKQREPQSPGVRLSDIAARTGLNISTVSRALRGERRWVSEEVIARVRAVADEMGYNPTLSHTARRLALQKYGRRPLSHALAVLVPQRIGSGAVATSYFSCMFEAILDYCAPQGFGLFTTYGAQPLHPLILRGEVDGLIAVAQSLAGYPEIAGVRLPVLTLIDEEPPFSAVLTDDRTGGSLAAGYLLDLGHRHIAHFHSPSETTPIGNQRYAGYLQACRARGLDPSVCLISVNLKRGEGSFTISPHVQQLFKAHPETTAILARNDYEAVLIWHCLSQMGLRVPEDISLVGFDDASPILNAAGVNILTTIHSPLQKIASEGARLLLQHLTDEAPIPARTILPTSLIVRATTAPPKS